MTREEFQDHLGFDVPSKTFGILQKYEQLLLKWQSHINLIGPSTTSEIWRRHFLDSAQLVSLLPDPSVKIVDLGSGAGFPGAVLAAFGYTNVTLIEVDQRKCSFLRTVARETLLPFVVYEGAIETYSDKVDVVVSRALAPLEKLITYAESILSPGAYCLFLKGETYQNEITRNISLKSVTIEKIQSKLQGKGVILKVTHL
jgi:16S rRNA (guanine527-N7)-methyltransferase